MTTDSILPDKLKRAQTPALLAGVVLVAFTAFMAMTNPGHLQSYLIGYLYGLGFALGGLLILSPIHLAGGAWSMNVRRIAEAAAGTIPVFALLFIPIALNADKLYPWMHIDQLDHVGSIVAKKTEWLNHRGFQIRAVCYFVFWILSAQLYRSWSARQDETGDPAMRRKMKWIAGPVALFHFLFMTGAAIDWGMSLEPVWFSSIYGVMFVIGQVLSILGLSILVLGWLSDCQPFKSTLTHDRMHSLGKLQFAFIVFWTYVELSQFVIIYAANLPEENTWYINRAGAPGFNSPYALLTFGLVCMQFVLPFLVLLNRQWKSNRNIMPKIALYLLVVRAIDLYWIISPSIHEPVTKLYVNGNHEPVAAAAGGPLFSYLDVVGPLGFALLFLGLFLFNYRKRPVLPKQDPMFSEKLEHEIKAAA